MHSIFGWAAAVGIALIALWILTKVWKFLLSSRFSLLRLGLALVITAMIAGFAYMMGTVLIFS